jgi:hypothetical protein
LYFCLKLIDNDWYLIAYCHFRQAVRMFAVVRIRSARETDATFRRRADFQMDGYLGASFRALRGDERHRIALRFTPCPSPTQSQMICGRGGPRRSALGPRQQQGPDRFRLLVKLHGLA